MTYPKESSWITRSGFSIVIALFSTALAVAISTVAAYALSRMNFRGRHHFVAWVLSTRMMPPVAVAIPMFFIYKDFGLLDTYTGVILIHALMNLPLAVLLLKSFFDDIPQEIDESAVIDGDQLILIALQYENGHVSDLLQYLASRHTDWCCRCGNTESRK